MFTSIEELSSFENGIALPFVAWSVYPRRTEGLIRSSLAKLSDFKPSFALLDEENQNVRAKLAEWFPGRFDADVPLGSGALIWIVAGVPVQCAIGQYLTEYEILKASRILWAASEQ